jgi:hypothetical protein
MINSGREWDWMDDKNKTKMSEEIYQCPICDCHNTEAQYDYPHMSECNACGSEWITETREVTLDAYKDV